MIIVNAILYLSSCARYSILSFNQLFIIEILPYWFVAKNIGNYRKYDIFFNFRFTGNMIFPSIAENQENMIFTLSGFTKMFFFIQCNRNYNTYRLLQICFYHPFVLSYKPKKRVWFAARCLISMKITEEQFTHSSILLVYVFLRVQCFIQSNS